MSFSTCATQTNRHYLDKLGDLIGSSTRIEILEHSSEWDAMEGPKRPLLPKTVVYQTAELKKSQIAEFRSVVANLDRNAPVSVSICIFAPHHSIRFYRATGMVSTLEVCFQCHDLRWDLDPETPPESLIEGLETIVEDFGLHPHRNWDALAREHAADAHQSQH